MILKENMKSIKMYRAYEITIPVSNVLMAFPKNNNPFSRPNGPINSIAPLSRILVV